MLHLTENIKKHVEKLYTVKAVEIEKQDFMFFNDNNLESTTEIELKTYLMQHLYSFLNF